jgi:DHA2 family multidrug resistance protein
MRRTSVRLTIALGFVIMAAGCLMNIHLNGDAAGNVIVPSLVIRGIGQSLIVVALGVMAVQGLEKVEMGSASGLFSMVRNVGGAIGIAGASQFVVDRAKLHAAHIGEAVTVYAPATRERMVDLVRTLTHTPVPRTAALTDAALAPQRQQALAILDHAVQREALLLAYSDAFLVAGLAMLACAAGSLLLKGKR